MENRVMSDKDLWRVSAFAQSRYYGGCEHAQNLPYARGNPISRGHAARVLLHVLVSTGNICDCTAQTVALEDFWYGQIPINSKDESSS